MQKPSARGRATQSLVRVAEIRDGVAIMFDGTMRATLMVSSINFALKSEEEQRAIVFAYQDFLNSLNFSVQISITSRQMDVTPYIEYVKSLRELQSNDLLRLQLDEYANFVSELVKSGNIMSKSFYVTVPFALQQSKKEGFFGRIFKGLAHAAGKRKLSDEEFARSRVQLMQRVNQAAMGLRSIGLRLYLLQTQELLELYYNLYNPVTSRNARLRNVAQLRVQENVTQS